MKINKSIIIGLIGIFIGAISVYIFTGDYSEADTIGSKQTTMNDQNGHNEHSGHGMNNEGQEKPTMPGQEAFGTIQEIIGILKKDPNTDWSKVDIPALKKHLIDMNEVTLYANVDEKELENGLEMKVTGNDRTIGSIKRMVPTHVQMTLNKVENWEVKVKEIDNGVILKATSQKSNEIEHIKGLGFIGLMATGANHPSHHLMMAKGEMH